MIFFKIKVKLNHEAFLQRLQLGFGNEATDRSALFKGFSEFRGGQNYLCWMKNTQEDRCKP